MCIRVSPQWASMHLHNQWHTPLRRFRWQVQAAFDREPVAFPLQPLRSHAQQVRRCQRRSLHRRRWGFQVRSVVKLSRVSSAASQKEPTIPLRIRLQCGHIRRRQRQQFRLAYSSRKARDFTMETDLHQLQYAAIRQRYRKAPAHGALKPSLKSRVVFAAMS